MISLQIKIKAMNNSNFWFLELIGSLVLLLLDPDRSNNKKYLSSEYTNIKIIIGGLTVLTLMIIIIYYWTNKN